MVEVEPGVQLVDTPEFPETYKGEALQQREALNFAAPPTSTGHN